jgi:hypothetical protein
LRILKTKYQAAVDLKKVLHFHWLTLNLPLPQCPDFLGEPKAMVDLLK